MLTDKTTYEEALLQMTTIRQVKCELHLCAKRLCYSAGRTLFLPVKDIEQMLGRLEEALDDLFYAPLQDAQAIQETYESVERQSALREWDSRTL